MAAPDEHKRFQLLGVIASASGHGSALITVDGQAPKPYRVGQSIDGRWLVQDLSPRSVTLKSQGLALELSLPVRKQD